MFRLKSLLTVFICLLWIVATPALAQESGLNPGEDLQTNPKDRDITISATVADDGPPTIPILVSPSNNSTVTTSRPTFKWQESTDTGGMSFYQLSLDGNSYFNNIPLTPVDNSQYTLTKSGIEYSLTPKSDITDGTHTWKIRAVDNNNNGRDSATWTFTIDTQAPTLVVTNIGERSVSISAQDASTIPSEPIEITTNQPQIRGTTEANSSIIVTLSIPNQSNQTFTTTADHQGYWNVTFPLLDREVEMEFDVQSTDLVNHTSTIIDIPFIIKQQFIFPTSTPSPTPIAGPSTPLPSVSPSPGITPSPLPTPTFTPSPIPTPAFFPPFSVPPIPVTPPKEIVRNIFDVIIPAEIIQAIPNAVKETVTNAGPIGSALIAGALPLTATAAIATQFGWGLSLQLLIRILQAIGILPLPKPQGVVFDSESEQPVPFATIHVQKVDDFSVAETLITNTDGVYGGIHLTPGKYQLEVRHSDYFFPTTKKRPNYLSIYEFYKGEVFETQKQTEEKLFMIPVDRKNQENRTAFSGFSGKLFKERLLRLANLLIIPIFIMSLVIFIFYPTLINGLITLVYIYLIGSQLLHSFKIPRIKGQVITDTGQPLQNVFVRISDAENGQLVSLLTTDIHGEFEAFIPKGVYSLSLTKPEYIWVDGQEVQSIYVVDTQVKRVGMVATMKSAQAVYKELFGDNFQI